MVNPLRPEITKGTVGELLVQLKLLTFNIESFPPLQDSGNDLIACFGYSLSAIQVKTKQQGDWEVPLDRMYHLLALVDLVDEKNTLDKSRVYLLTQQEAWALRKEIRADKIDDKFKLTEARVGQLRYLDSKNQLSIL